MHNFLRIKPKRIAAAIVAMGANSGQADALNVGLSFYAPLQGSVVLSRGVGAASFTRATTGALPWDFEGNVVNVLSGEVRFPGMRRVHNRLFTTSEDFTSSAWTKSNLTASDVGDSINGWPADRLTLTGGLSGHATSQSAFSVLETGMGPSWAVFTVDVSGLTTKLAAIGITQPLDRAIFTWTGPRTIVIPTITAGCEAAWDIHGDYQATLYFKTKNIRTATVGTYPFIYFGAYGNYDGDGEYATIARAWCVDQTGASNTNPPEYVSVGAPKRNELIHTEDFSQAAWAKNGTASVTGTSTVNLPAASDYVSQSVTKTVNVGDTYNGRFTLSGTGTVDIRIIRSGAGVLESSQVTVALTATPTAYEVSHTFANAQTGVRLDIIRTGVSTATEVTATKAQLVKDDLPAYFPVGNVYPYHGACVDGVKYFNTTNGNTVSNNVVTEAAGEFIPESGLGYARLPNLSGSYFSMPDSAAASITGDIDLRVHVVMDDWTPILACLLAKDGQAPGTRSYNLLLTNVGALQFNASADGTTLVAGATSTASVGATNGTAKWVRATYNSTNGAVNFYISDNGVSWTALGVEQIAAAIAIADTAAPVTVGMKGDGTTQPFAGTVMRAQVFDGIDGNVVVDFNPTDWASGGSFVSSTTGETWTLNGGAVIRKYPMGYLVEESTTNICLRSEDFGSAPWVTVNTPTRVVAADRIGSVVLDEIGDDDVTTLEGYVQPITFTGDGTKAVSVYFKQGTSTSSVFNVDDGGVARLFGVLTWTNGLPSINMTVGSLLGIDALNGGGYRARMTATGVVAAGANVFAVYPACNAVASVVLTGTLKVGGVQVENKAICTSYMPTLGASVTRNTDVLSYPAAGNVVLDGGSLFIETFRLGLENSGNGRAIYIHDQVIANGVGVVQSAASVNLSANIVSGGVSTFSAGVPAGAAGVFHKNAVRYKTNDSTFYADGTAGAFGAVNAPVTLNKIDIGHNNISTFWNGLIRNGRIWQRPLSDLEFDTLTR